MTQKCSSRTSRIYILNLCIKKKCLLNCVFINFSTIKHLIIPMTSCITKKEQTILIDDNYLFEFIPCTFKVTLLL